MIFANVIFVAHLVECIERYSYIQVFIAFYCVYRLITVHVWVHWLYENEWFAAVWLHAFWLQHVEQLMCNGWSLKRNIDLEVYKWEWWWYSKILFEFIDTRPRRLTSRLDNKGSIQYQHWIFWFFTERIKWVEHTDTVHEGKAIQNSEISFSISNYMIYYNDTVHRYSSYRT